MRQWSFGAFRTARKEKRMSMKIYLDIFFLINMGMNFVILLTESFFCQRTVRVRRLFASSVMGASIACVMLVLGVHRIMPLVILCYLAASILLIRTAFGKTTPGALVRNVVMFYVVAFVIAGMLVQLQQVFHVPLTGIRMLAIMSLVLLVLRWFLPRLQRRQDQISRYYRVKLHYDGGQIEGNALLDTGNCLYDPISHKPVMIGNAMFVKRLWKRETEPVMRVIPFHSVGKNSGLLQAFQAETLEVQTGETWTCIDKPWVAVCDKYVSVDGEYEVILHPDMLIKEKNKEDN